ncbi:formate hydrogenlyase complex iron-sulfur subunit, partial [Klebsiella oxytoca]
TVEAMRPQFETCPECKRKRNLLSDGQENISMGNVGSVKK